MSTQSRRSFFKAVGGIVAAGIAGLGGGYLWGSSTAPEQARRSAQTIIDNLEAEIRELKEKLSQYEIRDRELRFYFWSETMPEQLVQLFEEKTGVKVIFDTFESSDEVYAKLFSGQMPYDVTSVTMGGMTREEHEKYLLELDMSKIPNFRKYAFDGFVKEILNPPFDPDRRFSVPVEMGDYRHLPEG